ncbi:MAG: hypothetical protein LH473_05670 [Chitinophagales bacterium]|nr:hypothetical protein [Chitinophagales bacterium]
MSAKKILLRIGIGIATFLLLLFITLEVITLVFSGDIKAFVISQLNKQLATEVKVNGAITFSLFNHFPSASITFNDVVIKE